MRRTWFASAGFTIVEMMLFLAITGVLLTSAMLLFNGRIARTQFSQAVQEFDNKIKGTINEVSAGTFPSSTPFSCTVSGTGQVQVTAVSGTEQGTRTDCIFLGKVIQVGINGQGGCSESNLMACRQLNIYTAVGRRTTATGKEVQSLSNTVDGANPTLIDGINPPGETVNLTQSSMLGAGMSVSKIVKLNDNTATGAIGIMQTLGSYESTGSNPRLNPGAQTVQIWPVSTGAYPRTLQNVHDAVSTNANATFAPGSANPSQGILICLTDGSQKASITIGAAGGKATTTVVMGDSQC